jgi:hypothetical protein
VRGVEFWHGHAMIPARQQCASWRNPPNTERKQKSLALP